MIKHVILRKKTFGSDDDLPLNKLLKLHNVTIFFRSVFEEDDKYYPLSFFQMNICMSYKNDAR